MATKVQSHKAPPEESMSLSSLLTEHLWGVIGKSIGDLKEAVLKNLYPAQIYPNDYTDGASSPS